MGEDGHEGGQIRQMAAAKIRIVQQKDIARMDVVTKKIGHRLHSPGQGANVHGNMLRLGHQPSVVATDGSGKIPARIQYLRIRGPQHRLAHFLGDRHQAVLDNRGGDRIYFGHGTGSSILTPGIGDGSVDCPLQVNNVDMPSPVGTGR